jgi:predicted amidohydrolase YtcJ
VRMHEGITRRSGLFALAGGASSLARICAQQVSIPTESPSLVINKVRIFDAVNDQLKPGNVLISDRKIKQISGTALSAPSASTVINAGGRILMPGLTDAHWHMTMATNMLDNLQHADTGLMYANTVVEARRTVLPRIHNSQGHGGPEFWHKSCD